MPAKPEGDAHRTSQRVPTQSPRGTSPFFRWLAVVLWMCGVFALSSLSDKSFPKTSFPQADKVVHGLIYAVGGLLMARAARNPLPAILIPILFGATDEWHQRSVPGRHPDTHDWFADCLGTLAGVLLYYAIRSRRSI